MTTKTSEKVRGTLTQLYARLKVMIGFLFGQGTSMVANVLFGLLCVRLLPATDYAKFVVVYGIQSVLLILMDANFSGTIIPLIGERWQNKRLVAEYVASLRQLSIWAFGLVALGTLFGVPLLLRHRAWSELTVAGIIATLLAATWFVRLGSAYGPVLILFRDRTMYYRFQVIGSIGSLLLLLLAWKLHLLNAFVAMWLNILQSAFTGLACCVRARKLLGGSFPATAEKRQAIIRLAAPNMPQSFFYAVQGQISLFLITYLGRATAIASVGALGRLGQLFSLFQQANTLLVEPYFAKLPKEQFRLAYARILLLSAAILISITGFVILYPQPLLWALGPQYAGLRFEMQLAVTASAVGCFSGVLWGVHVARRFLFWWNGLSTILLTLVVQAMFIVKADMSRVRGVLWMNLAVNVASLLVNVATGIWGIWKGPREAERPMPSLSEAEIQEKLLAEIAVEGHGQQLEPPIGALPRAVLSSEE